MAYSLTVAGYTFENPPEEYRKLARLSNSPQKAYDRKASDFYQSDSQNLQFQVEGSLALDPPLGETEDDLDELERLQQIAIEGGEVEVQFDPFFSGTCIIEDDPFRQSAGESTYSFTFSVNSESTDASSYPARSPPTTGNTFELGSLDIGYDPDSVSQNYERETAKVKRLQGVARTVDNAGLVPTVNVSGKIDGEGQATLWQKARDNVMAYLGAEFQNGWCLIDSLSIRNDPEAPDYLEGLFSYDLDVLIVKNPASGIGDVTTYIDQEVKESGTYSSDSGAGDSDFTDLEFTVSGGSGSLDGDYIEWNSTTPTLSDNDTNYVYVDDADADGYGTVKANQSAFPADALELYRVETSGGVITKVVDVRAILIEDQESEEGDSTEETIGGDIYLTIAAGDYEMNTGVVSSWNDTRLLLQPNTTNYIWAEDPEADGTATVETKTSGYPTTSDFVKLHRAETDADSVTNLIDDRPADISDGSTDTASADLNFQEDLSLSDAGFSFERLLSLSDIASLAEAIDLWLGLVDLTDTLSVSEDAPGFTGVSDLATETAVLDDGGSASVGGVTETLSWGSTSDWDSAASASYVVHDGDGDHPGGSIVQLGEEYTTGTNVMLNLPLDESSGPVQDYSGRNNDGTLNGTISLDATGIANTTAASSPGDSGNRIEVADDPSFDPGDQFTVSFWIKADSNQTAGAPFVCSKYDGDELYEVHLNPSDASLRFLPAPNLFVDTDSGTFSFDQWDHWLMAYDSNAADMNIYKNASSVNFTVANGSLGDPMTATSSPVNLFNRATQDRPLIGDLEGVKFFSDFKGQTTAQELYNAGFQGSITTFTKSFSQAVKPDLAGLVYSLNAQTITVDVIGSPGTASEEIVSQSLDGSTSYGLAWNDSHTDFRVKVNFSTTDPTTTPTYDAGELEVDTGSVTESDQNPETNWQITPGFYDRSGNEYEGGGVDVRYEV